MSQRIAKPGEKESALKVLEEALAIVSDWCPDMHWEVDDIATVQGAILDVLEDLSTFEPLIEGRDI